MFYLYTILIGIAFASLFEWTLHKFIMHKTFLGFTYPFKAHAIVHHGVFKADRSYHAQRREDVMTIPMKWWNGPALILIGSLLSIPFSLIFENWWVTGILAIIFSLYYMTYEYIHWCFHLPKARRVERSWIFRKLNAHHLLHHRYMHKNFNVVFPFADLILGTLMLRSKLIFPQATCPSLPNVQPRIKMRRRRLHGEKYS